MTAATREVAQAKARAAEFFGIRQTRAGVVARRLLDMPANGDAVLADHLMRESRRRTRMDGSVDGSLVKSSWALLELLQLDCPPDHAGIVRVLGWLLSQQERAGRFGEGCSEDRHARGLCQHFLAGFFTAGGPAEPIAPLTFPNGVTVHDEAPARFAASCFALRAALRARQERRQGVLDHVTSLVNLGEVWGSWGGPWPPDVVFFALSGLAHAPLAYRERVERVASQVSKRQGKNGEWAGADTIHAVDVLLAIPSTAAQAAVRAAVPAILTDAEAFSESGSEERSLIALRALLTVS
jgi:hypothetical protein